MLNLKIKEALTGRAHCEMVITSRTAQLGRFILGRFHGLTPEERTHVLDHLDQVLTELQDALDAEVKRG